MYLNQSIHPVANMKIIALIGVHIENKIKAGVLCDLAKFHRRRLPGLADRLAEHLFILGLSNFDPALLEGTKKLFEDELTAESRLCAIRLTSLAFLYGLPEGVRQEFEDTFVLDLSEVKLVRQ